MYKTIFLTCLLLLSACGTTGKKDSTHNNQPDLPAWVMSPELKGHIAVSASAMPQNFGGNEAQHRVAILRAQSELAKRIQMRIENRIDTYQDNKGGKEASSTTTASTNVALTVENAFIKAEWTDPSSGELFIWYVLPLR